MSFLTPLLAGVAAAIAIPTLIILYFLKLRRRDVEVSTTLLWKKAVQDLQANAPFQKLRRNILLLLQLLILIALIFALAQPQFQGEAASGGRMVIFIDRSASMNTLDAVDDDGKAITRLERAKRDVIAYVDTLGANSTGIGLLDDLLGRDASPEAMIVSFDAHARKVHDFTSSKSNLIEAIERITPTDQPGDFGEAARLTDDQVGARQVRLDGGQDIQYEPGVPAIIWSDGAVANFASLDLHPESAVTYNRIGSPDTTNHSITAMRAERAYDRPDEAVIFVGIQSTSPEPTTIDIELAINGLVAAVKDVEMPAAESPSAPSTSGAIFRLNRPQGGVLSARIVQDDPLPADNTARLVVPPAKRLAVALVSEGNLYISVALEDMRLSRRAVLTPEQFESMRQAGTLDEFDVYILDRYLPEGAAFGSEEADGGFPPGRYLVYGVVPPIRGFAPALPDEKSEPATVIDWDRRHPVLSFLNLDPIIVLNPIGLRATSAGKVLVRGSSGPLMVEGIGERARAIGVGFAVAESTWVFDPSFVLFIARALQYLGDDGAQLVQQSIQPGENIVTRIPASAERAILTHPDGSTSPLVPAPDGRVSYGPIERAGLYTVSWVGTPGPNDEVIDGRPERPIAVNLFDAVESRAESLDSIALPIRDVEASNLDGGPTGLTSKRLWPWLIMGALAIMMLEWFVYNRKVHI